MTDLVAKLIETIEVQQLGCLHNGSTLYGDVLAAVADDVRAGGPTAAILGPWADAPFGDAVLLRFLAAVHRLALDGRAPELAAQYPSTGGRPDRHLGATFLATVEQHRAELAPLMADGVQTNEPGRSAALVGGLLFLAADGRPVRLLEVGASAGLNLRLDHYRYQAGADGFGPERSPLRFVDPWVEGTPPLDVPLRIVERRGCDLEPIDPTTDTGRARLRSFVWPDQEERLARLDAALAVAPEVPAPVDAADGPLWLARQLATVAPGRTTVVMHSIMFQYLPQAGREAMLATIAEAGRRATPDAPLAWLRMEPGGERADVRLTAWPGGGTVLLATSGYHGPPVHWLADPPVLPGRR